jgi:hypothetical protein
MYMTVAVSDRRLSLSLTSLVELQENVDGDAVLAIESRRFTMSFLSSEQSLRARPGERSGIFMRKPIKRFVLSAARVSVLWWAQNCFSSAG